MSILISLPVLKVFSCTCTHAFQRFNLSLIRLQIWGSVGRYENTTSTLATEYTEFTDIFPDMTKAFLSLKSIPCAAMRPREVRHLYSIGQIHGLALLDEGHRVGRGGSEGGGGGGARKGESKREKRS